MNKEVKKSTKVQWSKVSKLSVLAALSGAVALIVMMLKQGWVTEPHSWVFALAMVFVSAIAWMGLGVSIFKSTLKSDFGQKASE
ncbi:hypothetical protein [Aliagarivorans taiwanensis]|uniref:hypothetical protein n=1 Tax=Aliagarivorans taiwanensis TaxID=561966 RepID=UPI0004096B34|nr:hypothetical protein [Aliagarivorans taiwanensis]